MAKIDINRLGVESVVLPIRQLKVRFSKEIKSCKSNKERLAATNLVLPDGRDFAVSGRFWNSFSSLFNLGINLFEYFTHDEVFTRLTERKGNQVRLTIEGIKDPANPDSPLLSGTLLSCTNPLKPVLKVSEVQSMVDFHDGSQVVYETGIIQASFKAPFPTVFQVAGSDFSTRFMMVLPVDGYGTPSAYLELQRDQTQSIISASSKAFRTQFQLGKDDTGLASVLERAISTFNNEEGYHTFKQRLDQAATSWASFHEAGQLHGLIELVLTADGFELDEKRAILNKFNEAVGNPLAYYGISSANELSNRKAKTIPVQATLFDLFNFVTEINTHYIKTRGGKQRLNEWVGLKLAQEYDLEGTVTAAPEFKDFFLSSTRGKIEAISQVGDRQLDLDDGPVPAPVLEVENLIPDPVEELLTSTEQMAGPPVAKYYKHPGSQHFFEMWKVDGPDIYYSPQTNGGYGEDREWVHMEGVHPQTFLASGNNLTECNETGGPAPSTELVPEPEPLSDVFSGYNMGVDAAEQTAPSDYDDPTPDGE